MTPYYDEDGITIYHGDCRELLPWLDADVMVTDPPYGIGFRSNMPNALDGIQNDHDTTTRNAVLELWGDKPAAVFGSWKRPKPSGIRTVLVWEKAAGGMGDLSLPWAPNWEEIYIMGDGWNGHRGGSVLRGETIVTWNTGPAKRYHPNQKPIGLLRQIIAKAPVGVVCDPFMGSGSTLRAAADEGRQAIGIEIEEKYCEIAVRRLAQGVLKLS